MVAAAAAAAASSASSPAATAGRRRSRFRCGGTRRYSQSRVRGGGCVGGLAGGVAWVVARIVSNRDGMEERRCARARTLSCSQQMLARRSSPLSPLSLHSHPPPPKYAQYRKASATRRSRSSTRSSRPSCCARRTCEPPAGAPLSARDACLQTYAQRAPQLFSHPKRGACVENARALPPSLPIAPTSRPTSLRSRHRPSSPAPPPIEPSTTPNPAG